MKLIKNQRGASLIGRLIVVALFVFFAMFVFKLFPSYMQNFTIRSTLEGLKEDGLQEVTAGNIRQSIQRRFKINNVQDVTPDQVAISREADLYRVSVDYEVRVPFVFNVDLVARFSESAEVPVR